MIEVTWSGSQDPSPRDVVSEGAMGMIFLPTSIINFASLVFFPLSLSLSLTHDDDDDGAPFFFFLFFFNA